MQPTPNDQPKMSARAQDYAPPTSGILSALPPRLVPFGELIRIDKPVGIIYLYTPCATGTLLAASLSDPVTTPSRLLATNLILLLSSISFRSMACAWNDVADQGIDQDVERTRLRPIARGAVSTKAAHICTGILLLLSLALQSQLPVLSGQLKNLDCVYYSVPFILAAGIYPFLKRVTHYPQILLGFLNSWGVVQAFPALGQDLFDSQTHMAVAGYMMIYVITWTALNDTIYAFQDLNDDLKLGVKSMAVQHKNHAKVLFGGLAMIQVCSLLLVGIVAEAGLSYYAGVSVVLGLLSVVIRSVALNDPKSCAWWFQRGCHFVDAAFLCCFFGQYVGRT